MMQPGINLPPGDHSRPELWQQAVKDSTRVILVTEIIRATIPRQKMTDRTDLPDHWDAPWMAGKIVGLADAIVERLYPNQT